MKDKMDIQFGEALTADFEENTWTFQMSHNFKVRAGEFLITPKEDINAQLIAVAPEMLESLSKLVEMIRSPCVMDKEGFLDELDQETEKAEHIINKALGQEDSRE